MKFFEISKDSIEEVLFDISSVEDMVNEIFKTTDGIIIVCNGANLICGMETVSFRIYINQYNVDNNVPAGTVYLEIQNNKYSEEIYYQISFSMEEFEKIKNFA